MPIPCTVTGYVAKVFGTYARAWYYALPIYRQPLVIETIRKAVIPGAGGVIGGLIGLFVGGPVGMLVGGTIGTVTGYAAQVFGTYARAWYGH